MKKNKTATKSPAQLMLNGRKEPPQKDSGGLIEFMKVSRREAGLLGPRQAAMVLGITAPRVVQLIEAGTFRKWSFFGKTYVSSKEVYLRRASDVKTGRPPRNLAKRLALQTKILQTSDLAQIAGIMFE